MRQRYPIIGLTGPARTGKDTAAAFLVALTGGYRYAFADPLRAMLKAGLGIDMDEPYWQTHKESPVAAFGHKSPRQMLQWLGTEWGRNMVDRDIWLTLAKNELATRGPGMIVSDVRYENEAQWVRNMGGKVVHMRREAASSVHLHASENGVEISENDIVLENNGSLEELQSALKDIAFGVKA